MLCPGSPVDGLAWGTAGVILFTRSAGPIYRVSASGGPCVPATTLDTAQGETGHYAPKFLPMAATSFFWLVAKLGEADWSDLGGFSGFQGAGSLGFATAGASYAGPPRSRLPDL